MLRPTEVRGASVGEIPARLIGERTQPFVFRDIKDHEGVDAAGNLFATRESIATALGTDRAGLFEIVRGALGAPRQFEVSEQHPYTRKIRDLDALPVSKWFSGDAGPYINSAAVHASHKGKSNLAVHRLLRIDGRRFATRLVERHTYAMWNEARKKGEEVPVTLSVGCDPTVMIACSASMPFGEDELRVASAMEAAAPAMKREMRAYEVEGLVAPDAEIVMVGRITKETCEEGPYVDATGTMDQVRDQPVIEVDAILAKPDPVFHALLPGGYEHFMFMGMPKEPQIFNAVAKVVPKVHAARLTEGGGAWLHGVVSIDTQREGDGKNAILAALAAHPSMKMVTVVNGDIDIFDDRAVEWAVATRFQADRDLVILGGMRGSSLDPSAPSGKTAKMGIDATIPQGEEEKFRKWL
jgi:UbiD family decarboxylase